MLQGGQSTSLKIQTLRVHVIIGYIQVGASSCAMTIPENPGAICDWFWENPS